MKDAKIWEATEARQIAEELIPKHHTRLLDHPVLGDARLLYLFTDRKRKKGNRVTLGTAAKLPALQRYLSRRGGDPTSEAHFILLFSYLEWDLLEPEQQVALVDHELCHCTVRMGKDFKSRWAIREHDVEEFTEIIQRHGLWKPDLAEMGQAMQQLPLQMEA